MSSMNPYDLMMSSPPWMDFQMMFMRRSELEIHMVFLMVPNQDIPKIDLYIFIYINNVYQNMKPWFFFPERLGEGRFLGAVSLSSMT